MKLSRRLICMMLALVLLAGSVPLQVFASGQQILGVAFVDATSLRLRSEASTSSRTLDTAKKGEVVVVLEKNGDWYKVSYDLKEGYMHSDYLEVKSAEDVELGYGKVNANSVNLRSGAGTSYKSVDRAGKGDKGYIIGVNDGWYKLIFENTICYIRSDYMDLTEIPYENKSSSKSPLFFRGGKSTGVEPSASALNGEAPKAEAPKEEKPKEEAPAETPAGKEEAAEIKDTGIVYGLGFVNASTLRLRSKASTSSDTLATAKKDEVVVVLAKSGDWYKVIYNLREGYMHEDYLKVKTSENAELGYGKVSGSSVNLRSGPSTSYKSVGTASRGTKAYILGVNDGWYKIICGDEICYIRSNYLDLTEVPYENNASSKSPKFFRGGKSTGVTPSASALNGGSGSSGSSASSGSTGSLDTGAVSGSKIVDTAKKYLGVRYKWGGASPSGFDCSGFVYYVMRSNGIKISRTLSAMYKQGTPVSKSELQPGDIVFFQGTYKSGLSHAGIYAGDGKFIHSPHTGKVVSYADLNSDYYTSHYYGACRVS